MSFNARKELGDKTDKLTVMMSSLAAKDSYEKRPFNPQIYKAEVRIGPIFKEVIRTEVVGQIVETEDSMGIIDLDKTIETTIFKGTLEDMEDKIVEEDIGIIRAMIIIEAGIGPEKEYSQGIMVTKGIEVPVILDQGQDLELVLIEIG